MALEMLAEALPKPKTSNHSIQCAARLGYRAHAYAVRGDDRRALNAFIAAADHCLGMVWWLVMVSGKGSADPHTISRMRKELRTFKSS